MSASEILSQKILFSSISLSGNFFKIQFCMRSQTRFVSKKRRRDAQCVGPLTDHQSHYQVLPNLANYSVLILRARVG